MMDARTDILRLEGLGKTFSVSAGLFSRPLTLTALEDISFSIRQGETLGIVGESGCGKSTLGRCILQLLTPDSGRVLWMGEDITRLPEAQMRKKRRDLQIIFQDPLASLNPRMTVGEIIGDPLRTLMPELDDKARRLRVLRMMESVGLLPEMINRYPHEFSGGQAQRIGIAPGADHRAQAHRLRRARLGARRLHPGADPQPAGRPQGRVRADARIHLAQSVGGPARVRPHPRALSGPYGGTGRG